MALILNIDTAVDVASICFAKDGKVLSVARNESQKDHASWLHIAIKEIFEKNNLGLRSVDAIAVTGGPVPATVSFTGLSRKVGFS
jgi:tRNA threonylcarbamoyladenosine biosynthesis protein TsaB